MTTIKTMVAVLIMGIHTIMSFHYLFNKVVQKRRNFIRLTFSQDPQRSLFDFDCTVRFRKTRMQRHLKRPRRGDNMF